MNLELASDDELIEELKRRYQTFAAIGMKEPANEGTTQAMIWRYQGNRFLVMGLLVNMLASTNADIERNITRGPAA